MLASPSIWRGRSELLYVSFIIRFNFWLTSGNMLTPHCLNFYQVYVRPHSVPTSKGQYHQKYLMLASTSILRVAQNSCSYLFALKICLSLIAFNINTQIFSHTYVSIHHVPTRQGQYTPIIFNAGINILLTGSWELL